MFCGKCGKEIKSGNTFCTDCGERSVKTITIVDDFTIESEKQLRELIEAALSIGDILDPLLVNHGYKTPDEYNLKELIKVSLIKYSLYLCSLSREKEEEKGKLIQSYFDYDLGDGRLFFPALNLIDFIDEDFATTIPPTLKLMVEIDNKVNSEGRIIYIDTFILLGKAIVHLDNSPEITKGFVDYIKMLKLYVEEDKQEKAHD